MIRHPRISVEDFLGRMQEYLTSAPARRVSSEPATVRPTRPNEFYTLDAETMLALTHAVEDTALEDAEGRLLCSFQDFAKFQTHRERYTQIAATLEEVLVLGVGRQPRPCGRTQFLDSRRTVLGRFWIALYQGVRLHALAISRQENDAEEVPDRIFRGFFTFDARVIGRIRREVFDALAGRVPAMPFFERWSALDLAERLIRQRWKGELDAIETSLARFRQHPHLSLRAFLGELNAALDRAAELREAVPPLFASSLVDFPPGRAGRPVRDETP